MLDSLLRPIINPPLNKAGQLLAKKGVRPDHVTYTGFLVGLLGALCLMLHLYYVALVLILMNRLCDGLDGAVARASEQESDFGGYLDIVLDFIFYSAVIFAFAIGHPEQAIAAAFLIFSFVGTGSSFLAYAIMAAKKGVETESRGKKSFFHAGGLAEGTETLITFVLICLMPHYFYIFVAIFGMMCWITTFSRITEAKEVFG